MVNEAARNLSVEKSIVFIYFNDLPKAMDFYENVMGFNLEIDQGWCKIYRTSASGYVGLVDGSRGFHKASETKPIILCFRVADVESWHSHIVDKGIDIHHPIKNSEELKIRAFLFNDPEGHTIEIQSAL